MSCRAIQSSLRDRTPAEGRLLAVLDMYALGDLGYRPRWWMLTPGRGKMQVMSTQSRAFRYRRMDMPGPA